jgi:hypothetical protein
MNNKIKNPKTNKQKPLNLPKYYCLFTRVISVSGIRVFEVFNSTSSEIRLLVSNLGSITLWFQCFLSHRIPVRDTQDNEN